jgi:molybdopterin-binding protein
VQRLTPFGSRVRVVLEGGLTAEITRDSAERMSLAMGDEVVASFKATGTRVVPRRLARP